MNERIGIIIGCAILLASCESSEELATSPEPSVEVSTTAELQPIAPPPPVIEPAKPQVADQPAGPPSVTQLGDSDQGSNPEPVQPESGVQPADAEPPVAGAIPAVVTVPPPKPVEEEIEAPPADTTPPDTALSGQPSAVSNQLSATFEFSCSDPVAAPFMGASSDAGVKPAPTCTFFCQLDVGTPSACTSPFTWNSVPEGSHAFSVHAVDKAGNKDETPASFAWTVDVTPPAFAGLKTARVVSTTEVVLSWEPSEESPATYQVCVGGSAGACKTLFTIAYEVPAGSRRAFISDLQEDATYYFMVRAVDAAGNVSTNEREKRATMKRGLTLAYRLDGPMNGGLGYSLSVVGDMDGDEKPDLLVGAPMAEFGGEMSGTVFLYSGADGSPLLQLDGDEPGAGLGTSVFPAGDVNSDGAPDFGAGAPLHGAMNPILGETGESVVFSGTDGSFLSAKTGPKRSLFGGIVENLGDVNSDGKSDCAWVLLGAPEGARAVDIGPCGGVTDSEIYSVRNPEGTRWTIVAPAGDVDRDGWPDFLVGDPWAWLPKQGYLGRVDLLSGKNGTLIRSILGSEQGGKFGAAAASLGDVNGDGFPDVAIGVPRVQFDGTFWVGKVCVHSGADGMELFCRDGERGYEGYGAVVVPAQDFNGDGKGDFAVAAVDKQVEDSSYVEIVSGADGGLLHLIEDPGSGAWFGLAMAVADLDGDGRPDLVVGAPHAKPDGLSFAGSVYVYITQ